MWNFFKNNTTNNNINTEEDTDYEKLDTSGAITPKTPIKTVSQNTLDIHVPKEASDIKLLATPGPTIQDLNFGAIKKITLPKNFKYGSGSYNIKLQNLSGIINTLTVVGTLTAGTLSYTNETVSNLTVTNAVLLSDATLTIQNATPTTVFSVNTSGNTSISGSLGVNGAITCNNSFFLNSTNANSFEVGTASSPNLTIDPLTGNLETAGYLWASGEIITTSASTDALVVGNNATPLFQVNGINGNVTCAGNLNANSNCTIGNNLTVDNNVSCGLIYSANGKALFNNTTTQSITGLSATAVNYSTTIFNTFGSNLTISGSNTFTNASGAVIYLHVDYNFCGGSAPYGCFLNGYVQINGSGNSYAQCLLTNGYSVSGTGTAQNLVVNGSQVIKLNNGDYFKVICYSNVNQTLNPNSAAYPFLSIYQLP